MIHTSDPKTILVADDEPSMRLNITELLQDEGYNILEAANGLQAIQLTNTHLPDVVLMDVKMPEMNGITTLKNLKREHPDIPVIIFTAFGSNEKPIEAMKAGAFDYMEKPFDIDELLSVIRKALKQKEASANREITELSPPRQTVAEEHIVGRSRKMKDILKIIGKVAVKNTTVLIEGESGTGKEVIADAIHRHSHRASAPFIKVNCGALPDSLLESELFGHEEGAFTGAVKKRKGRFELADGGTIFLDEINALTPPMQIKLLRVLQQFTFERVGGEKTIKTDARVIAATNKDLKAKIRDNSFREDLYYRLNIIHLNVPPLRERKDDIEPLAKFFLKKYAPAKKIVIAAKALDFLTSYHWPGNVRELENIIQRATVLMQGNILTQSDLSITLNKELSDVYYSTENRGKINFHEVVESVEKELIMRALDKSNWNKAEAARRLSINRRLLYSKIKQYNIDRD
jgi:two-component system, NtrC family, response regulator AtoC